MCFSNHTSARNAAANFLRRHPQWISEYERDYARYAEQGVNHKRPSGYPAHLAFASCLFDFGNLANPAM
jgi:hypothetical protein